MQVKMYMIGGVAYPDGRFITLYHSHPYRPLPKNIEWEDREVKVVVTKYDVTLCFYSHTK